MFRRLGNLLLIVAFLAATGGHWALLQSVAWTTMLADNLREYPLTQAMERTFNGKHPCEMCCDIARAKQQERKAELPPLAKKLECISQRPVIILNRPTNYRLHVEIRLSATTQAMKPDVPPPRFSLS